MSGSKSLTLGVATTGTIFDELLFELLDHQGVIYEVIEGTAVAKSTYPIVLHSRRSEMAPTLSGGSHVRGETILVAEDVIDINRILRYLSGLNDQRTDRFDFEVNAAEVRLSKAIKEKLWSLGLPLVTKSFWPEGAKACCVLTHDVDWLTYSPFHKATLAGGRGVPRALRLAAKRLRGITNYGCNIPETVGIEKKYGVKSTFFFRTEYDSPGTLLEESIDLLKLEGFEIGLHAAHSSYNSLPALKQELHSIRDVLTEVPVGVRHHILKFKAPETWIIENQAGLLYDATLAYNRFFGSRSAVCFPFHPFGKQRLPIIELPTSFMDWTALSRGSRGKKLRTVLSRIREEVEEYHGVLVVNFHNTYLNKETFPDVLFEYESLAMHVASHGYWVATARECVEWWKLRAASVPSPMLDGPGVVSCKESQVPVVSWWEGKEPERVGDGHMDNIDSPTLRS